MIKYRKLDYWIVALLWREVGSNPTFPQVKY